VQRTENRRSCRRKDKDHERSVAAADGAQCGAWRGGDGVGALARTQPPAPDVTRAGAPGSIIPAAGLPVDTPRLTGIRRVIVDTDLGNDDALAILMALSMPTLRVEAITVCPGNMGIGGADSFAGLSLPARIGDEGVFEFTNVAPGAYIIYADRGRRNGSTEGEFAAVPAAVAGEDVTGLTVQTSAGSTIAGRVTFDTGSRDNRPKASDLELTAVPIDFDLAPAQPAHADIQPDWTFWLRGVSGTRRLEPTRLPPGWALRALLVNGADATDRPLVFGRSGQSLADIEVVLTDRVSDIGGAVLDSDGHSVANTIVIAMPIDPGLRYPMSRYLRRTATRDDGAFHLTALPAGTYYLATVASIPIDGPDAWQDPAFLESLTPVVTTVTIGDGETRTVTLRAR